MLNQEANRKLFQKKVEIIFKAFNEEPFSHQGSSKASKSATPGCGTFLSAIRSGHPRRSGSSCFSGWPRKSCRHSDRLAVREILPLRFTPRGRGPIFWRWPGDQGYRR
jgi:hypothetical protein